jgi:1-acyl-sn-glycerol-3-phosphate acyltransferase
MQAYVRLVHRVQYEGLPFLPRGVSAGPLVVVCNHTAGIDPLLVQAACEFEVRWMMANDMRLPRFEPFWQLARAIGVDRQGRDTTSAREAIRHLKAGGVIGVFPEGGIERPPETLRPFFSGVGLIVARSGAPVLPVWIRGTPQVDRAWESLWTPSHARVTFGPLMRPGPGEGPAEITQSVRAWFREVSGWPDTD